MNLAFESVTAFVQMGHHGAFVWSAWGISLLCMLVLTWSSIQRRRQFFRQEAARLQRQAVQAKRQEQS